MRPLMMTPAGQPGEPRLLEAPSRGVTEIQFAGQT